MLTRRKWISLAAGFGAVSAAAYPTLFEPRWLELTSTYIPFGQWAKGKPIRILHLADLHASSVVPLSFIDQAIRIGLEQAPDLACLTGDFITSLHGFDPEAYAQSLQALTRQVPTYAVLGNHDGGGWSSRRGGFSEHAAVEQLLVSSGIQLLHNRAELIRVNGHAFTLAGVGDLWSGEVDPESAFRDVDPQLPTLLLAHNPDSKERLQQQNWRLMLCGHTHGGQVIIPFNGPRYAPVEDKAYVAGLKPWRDRQIFVTRGVGNVGGVRFRCRPEVSILNLV